MSLPRVANTKRKAPPATQPSSSLFQLTGEPLTKKKKKKALPSPKPSPRKEPKFVIVDDDDDDDDDYDDGGEATESGVSSCASESVIKSSGESSTISPTNPEINNPIIIDDDIAQILFFDGAEGCLLETSQTPTKEEGERGVESDKLTSVEETQQKDFQTEISSNKGESSSTKKLETTPRKHAKQESQQKKSEHKKPERGSSKSKSHKKSKNATAAITIKIDDEDDDEDDVIDDDEDDDDYGSRASIRTMFLKAAYSQGANSLLPHPSSSSAASSSSSSSSLSSSSLPSTKTSQNTKRSLSFNEQKDFSLISSNSANPTQRIQRKSSSISLLNNTNSINSNKPADTELFIDRYTPETSSELAVSDSAIKAFSEWATSPDFRNSKRILIISGPSGAGKTAMVRVVCRELGFSTIEYSPYGAMTHYDPNGGAYSVSPVDDFRSWVMRAAKGTSILSDAPLRFLVLEDFPFINSENSMKFRAVFADYLRFPRVMPMVIILSDSERFSRHGGSKNLAYSIVASFLLPTSEINPRVHSIKVNPVTLKKMRQALTKVAAKYGVKMGMTTVNDIVQECGKDIRSAMNMLQFSQFDFAGKKINCRKDFELSLFHGAGKILHPRFKELSPDPLQAQTSAGSGSSSKKTKSYPEHFLLESSGVKPHQIVECAVENIYGFISDIDSLADAFEAISLGDSIGGRRSRAKQAYGNAAKTSEEAQMLVAAYGIMNNITTESHRFYGLHASKLRSMEHLVKENSRALATIFDEFVPGDKSQMSSDFPQQTLNSQREVPEEGPPSWILSNCALLTEVIPFSGHLNEGKEYFRIVKELNYDIPDEMISDK